jgi:hypothetical protein
LGLPALEPGFFIRKSRFKRIRKKSVSAFHPFVKTKGLFGFSRKPNLDEAAELPSQSQIGFKSLSQNPCPKIQEPDIVRT